MYFIRLIYYFTNTFSCLLHCFSSSAFLTTMQLHFSLVFLILVKAAFATSSNKASFKDKNSAKTTLDTLSKEDAYFNDDIEEEENGDGRIVRGNLTQFGEFKFMAFIEIRWHNNNPGRCGGVIWNEDHILTAAHCL